MTQKSEVGLLPTITELDLIWRASHLVNLILACSERIKDLISTYQPLSFEIALALYKKENELKAELDDLMTYVNDRLRNHYGCIEVEDGCFMGIASATLSSSISREMFMGSTMSAMVDFDSVQRCLAQSIIPSLPDEVLGGRNNKQNGLRQSLRGDPYPKDVILKEDLLNTDR